MNSLIEAVLICVIGGARIVVSPTHRRGLRSARLQLRHVLFRPYAAGAGLLVGHRRRLRIHARAERLPPQPYRRAFEGMMNAIRLIAALPSSGSAAVPTTRWAA